MEGKLEYPYKPIKSGSRIFELMMFMFIEVITAGLFIILVYYLVIDFKFQIGFIIFILLSIGSLLLLVVAIFFVSVNRFIYSKWENIFVDDDNLILPYSFECRFPLQRRIEKIPLKKISLITDIEKEREMMEEFGNKNASISDLFRFNYDYFSMANIINDHLYVNIKFTDGSGTYYLGFLKDAFQGEKNLKRFLEFLTSISGLEGKTRKEITGVKNVKKYKEKNLPPKSWDNVSNNKWTYRYFDQSFGVTVTMFFVMIFLFVMTFFLFGLIFSILFGLIAYVYLFITNDQSVATLIVIIGAGIPTVILELYTIYALLRARNRYGKFHYSSVTIPKIKRKQMTHLVSLYFKENNIRFRRNYYWLMGTHWYIYSPVHKNYQLKIAIDRAAHGYSYNFHIGPIKRFNEGEIGRFRDEFSEWYRENIGKKTGSLPPYESKDPWGKK